jgi:hypothetical protein
MKKLWFLGAAILLLGLAMTAMAQDENAWSVYGGYYFVHTSISVNGGGTTTTIGDTAITPSISGGDPTFGFNFNGGGGQLAYNFNQDSKIKYGVVADFAGYHWSGSEANGNVFTYLFGPRVSFGDAKFTPFVQALFGGARGSGAFGGSSGSEEAFAMTVGGGLDWQINRHWFVRPVQAEYLLTDFSEGGFSTGHQNSFRYSAGVGFRWP